MATASTSTGPRTDHDDLLWNDPDGTIEEYPGGKYLFRWERTTYKLRSIKDDPDGWIVQGTGPEYRLDLAARSCSCPGYMTHKRGCKHLRAGMAFGAQLGSQTNDEDEDKLTDEQLRELFR